MLISLFNRNDLIRPTIPGQFQLRDLKRNGYLAERFFDTFMNFDRFQIHESYQGSIRAKRDQEMERLRQQSDDLLEDDLPLLDDNLGYFMIR